MFEAYHLTNWSFGGDTRDTRNHFHETALREARIASEYRATSQRVPERESFVTRLRLAFAGQPATEACSCAA